MIQLQRIVCLVMCTIASCYSLTDDFACAEKIPEIKFGSVAAIDMKDRPKREWFDNSPYPSELALVVTVTSEENLRLFLKEYEFTVFSKSFLCDEQFGASADPKKPLVGDSSVFDEEGKIEYGGNGRIVDGVRLQAEDVKFSGKYHLYVSLKSGPKSDDIIFSYDLQKNADNVCIQLSGGDESGASYSTNLVVVPKTAIVDAIK